MNREKLKLKNLAALLIVVALVAAGYFYFKKNSNRVIKNDGFEFNVTSFEQRIPSYGLRVIPIDSNTTDGAELVVYFDKNNGDTKIMEASYYGETFSKDYKYYFNDINNFFIIEIFEQWDRPYTEDGRQLTRRETNKYYFNDLFMTQWVASENNKVSPSLEEFKQKEREILEQTDSFLKIISTKNP